MLMTHSIISLNDAVFLSNLVVISCLSCNAGKIDQVFAEDVDTKDSVARPGSSQASTPTPLEAVGTTATAATGVAGVAGGHITRPPSRTGVVNPMLSEISLDSTDKL